MSKRQARIGGGIFAGGFSWLAVGGGGCLDGGEDLLYLMLVRCQRRDSSQNISMETSGGMMVLVFGGVDSGDGGDKGPCLWHLWT